MEIILKIMRRIQTAIHSKTLPDSVSKSDRVAPFYEHLTPLEGDILSDFQLLDEKEQQDILISVAQLLASHNNTSEEQPFKPHN